MKQCFNIWTILCEFMSVSEKASFRRKKWAPGRTEINIVVTAMLSLLPFFSTIFNFLARHQSRDLANFSITAWWCKDSKQLTQSFVRYAKCYAWKSNQEWIVRRLNGRVLKLLNEASSFDMCEMCVVFSFPLNKFYVRRKIAIHRKCDMNISMCPRACKFQFVYNRLTGACECFCA